MKTKDEKKEDGLRLLKIKTLERLTWQEMADIIEVKEPTLRQISCGRVPLSRKMCRNICDHFPKYNIEWLFKNEGEMYTSEYKDAIAETSNNPYAGWTATQLLKMVEQKENELSLMQQTIKSKDELITALRLQIELLQEKRATSLDRLVSAQLGESLPQS